MVKPDSSWSMELLVPHKAVITTLNLCNTSGEASTWPQWYRFMTQNQPGSDAEDLFMRQHEYEQHATHFCACELTKSSVTYTERNTHLVPVPNMFQFSIYSMFCVGPELSHCCCILMNMKWTQLSNVRSSWCHFKMSCVFGLRHAVAVLNGELLNCTFINTFFFFFFQYFLGIGREEERYTKTTSTYTWTFRMSSIALYPEGSWFNFPIYMFSLCSMCGLPWRTLTSSYTPKTCSSGQLITLNWECAWVVVCLYHRLYN